VHAQSTKATISWARCWIEGAGAAILLTLPLLYLHIAPLHTDLYHRLLPMNNVYCGVLIDLVVAILASTLVLRALHRYDPGANTLLWLLFFDILLMRVAICLGNAEILSRRISPGRVFLTAAVAGLLLWAIRRTWYRIVMRSALVTTLLVGFAIFWIIPQLAWMADYPEPHDIASFSKPTAQPPSRRIVWILLDELSYDQVFDHRYPGLALPNFDRLASHSVSFSDVQPAGYYTELIVPSLLEGHIVRAERSNLQGDFFVKTQGTKAWHPYPVGQTLFADAQRAGWSTAAAGWYLPYCREFAPVLDRCYWTFAAPLPGGYAQDQSVWWNAVAPVRKPLLRLVGIRVRQPTTAQDHAADFNGILAQGRAMIAGQDTGFVFIHLPVPHPAGFYNRRSGAMGVPGSYIDNLAVADRTLGQLLQDIDSTKLAGQTILIVSSDHSWRIPMWRPEFDWTKEDESASRGAHFDSRPVIIVHFPAQQNGVQIGRPFPLVDMHTMLQQMIAARIEDPQQLTTWAAQR
jgi:hypothetical protein